MAHKEEHGSGDIGRYMVGIRDANEDEKDGRFESDGLSEDEKVIDTPKRRPEGLLSLALQQRKRPAPPTPIEWTEKR